MTAKDFKLLIDYINDDFKLYVKTENGLIEVKNLELNIKEKCIVFNNNHI